MKKILFVIGSTRKGSFNRQLADEAAKLLEGKAEVSELDFSDLPFVNQDTEFPALPAVQRVRDEVAAADGVWVFSPEYNYSYPGYVKNLLDWLSRPTVEGDYGSAVAAGAKVTVSNAAGRSAGAGCRAKLFELAKAIRMVPMEEAAAGVVLKPESWQTGRLVLDDADREQLARQAEAFLSFV